MLYQWQTKGGLLEVKSFYRFLTDEGVKSFLWNSIWRVKVPLKVAFLNWTAASAG